MPIVRLSTSMSSNSKPCSPSIQGQGIGRLLSFPPKWLGHLLKIGASRGTSSPSNSVFRSRENTGRPIELNLNRSQGMGTSLVSSGTPIPTLGTLPHRSASRQNDKLPFYYSLYRDQEGVSTLHRLASLWYQITENAYPTKGLIPLVLCKLMSDQMPFMFLIAPVWTRTTWYPSLVDLLCHYLVASIRRQNKGFMKIPTALCLL